MKKSLSLILALALTFGLAVPSLAAGQTFNDVPPEYWGYADIEAVAQAGYMNGTGNGAFSPEMKVSVAQFLTLLGRLVFPEVKAEGADWFGPYVSAAQGAGLLTGTQVDVSNVEAEISRYDMAVILRAAAKKLGVAEKSVQSSEVTDYGMVPTMYADAVLAVYGMGLIRGDQAGNFNGSNTMMRAEVATVIMRLAKARSGNGTYGNEPQSSAELDDDWHIGIITGTAFQSEDDLRGAEKIQEIYGADKVKLATYPDNFMEEVESTIQTIVNMSADPQMKAIIVNQAVPGTAEAFQQVKEYRPDILCIAGESHEDLLTIGASADLVCNIDFVARGYLIVKTAHDLGCDTFVHISFPRHMSYEAMSRRAAIMQAACKEFGMKFVQETAPDPTTDVGVFGAQAYVLERAPEWIVTKYGPNSAYFCTSEVHVAPMQQRLLELDGYFIESDLPSPLMSYPQALGDLDLTAEAGDFDAILAKVEKAVCDAGGAGRFGTWAYPCGYCQSAGLAQHAIDVIEGKSEITNMDDIAAALKQFSPKTSWNGCSYIDTYTDVKVDNVFLIYQDTYIMGDPGKFMGSTEVEVPEKYFTIE